MLGSSAMVSLIPILDPWPHPDWTDCKNKTDVGTDQYVSFIPNIILVLYRPNKY